MKQPLMESLIEQFGLLPAGFLTGLIAFTRYAVFAGAVYLFFYVWKRRELFHLKIQEKWPNSAQLRHEIGHSLSTALIFGLMGLGIYGLRSLGYGRLYFDIHERSMAYYAFSIVLLIMLHDTYFYWTHRLMHHPRLFKIFHLTHHVSHNPTPWAAFSFHPLEAIVEFGIVPIIIFFVPTHWSAMVIFLIWSMALNVLGHSGFEFTPRAGVRHWLFKWFNTPTHHNLHHQRGNGNYGLYFNIWDNLMGTNHAHYLATFDAIKSRQPGTTDQPDTATTTTA